MNYVERAKAFFEATSARNGVGGCSFGTQSAPGGGTTFLAGKLQSLPEWSGYLLLASSASARVEQSGVLNESLSGSIVANDSFQLDFYDYGVNLIGPQPLSVTFTVAQTGGNTFSTLVTGTGTYSGSVTLSNVNLVAGLSTMISFSLTAPDNGISVAMNLPNSGFITFTPVSDGPSVPEPASVVLVGMGLAGAWKARFRLVRQGN